MEGRVTKRTPWELLNLFLGNIYRLIKTLDASGKQAKICIPYLRIVFWDFEKKF